MLRSLQRSRDDWPARNDWISISLDYAPGQSAPTGFTRAKQGAP